MYRSHRVHCKLVGSKNTLSHLQIGVSHHCSWLNCSFRGRVMSHRVFLNAIFRFMDGQGKHRTTVDLCGWFHENKRLGCSSSFCLRAANSPCLDRWSVDVYLNFSNIYTWHIAVLIKKMTSNKVLVDSVSIVLASSSVQAAFSGGWVQWGYMGLTPRCVLERMAWDMFWEVKMQVGYSKNCR